MRLFDFFDYYAQEFGHTEYVIYGKKALTYHQAWLAINKLANAFISSGLKVGDRISILSKNSIEYLLFYYAAAKAGVVPVPLNFRLSPKEWVYIINDAEVKLLLTSAFYQEAIENIKGELATVTQYIAIGSTEKQGWGDYHSWIENEPITPPSLVITDDQDVYQMYTSGTTGHPKGAILSHHAVTSNLSQMSSFMEAQRGERFLIVAPLYHAAAVLGSFICAFQCGTIYLQEDFIPSEVVRALSEEKVSRAGLVPAMIQACLTYVPDIAKRDFSALKSIVYGASPISESTLRNAIEIFKCDFIQIYGMTETTVALTALLAKPHREALEGNPSLLLAAGRAVPNTEIRIVDSQDNDLPMGATGEIIARGPQLMKGYWKKDEENKETLRGGWMHTGDAGYIDKDGFLYVQDRVKDMIISGGENVYPRTVEDVLFQYPGIIDAAVIGVPDEKWGETVKAIVVLRKGETANQEEVIKFCRERLGGFECPTSVDFVEMLPRNPSGKVLKRELREPFWVGYKRRVS
ncbi:MAG: long-chain-fatty-acid--CoA ligase [Acidobacteria bacterium]|nr:long-chain-fatty-acid--CoA ligase [Acidobacteriota bacterium]